MLDLPIPLLTLSDPGRIVAANREAELQLYPFTRRLVGTSIDTLNERLAHGFHRARQIPSAVIVRDVAFESADRNSRWDAIIRRTDNGEAFYLLLMPTAVQSDDSHVDLAKFAHILSHEIKNPLAGISGAAQMVRRSAPAGTDMGMLDIIDAEVIRVGRLIDRLSNFELFNAPKPQAENIHALLDQVMNAEKAAFGDRIAYQKIYDPSLPLIDIDRDHIQEAVQNVLRNAAEAIESATNLLTPPTIMIRTGFVIGQIRRRQDKRAMRSVEIRIVDNGPGIPAHKQKLVFGAFQSTKKKGRGLGLSIVKEIITAHGGSLKLRSRVGHTSFSMVLPVSSVYGGKRVVSETKTQD